MDNHPILRIILFSLLSFLYFFCSTNPEQHSNIVTISENDTVEDIVRKAAHVAPSPRQLAWQELEFTAFIHFTINTFTDREWGDGSEDPSLFKPTALDANQWAEVCRDAGMKLMLVTAKHHDGFCLWPSAYTDHSVKNSPWKNGNGDVIREVSDACRKAGLKFGVYLSPWDRHEPSYGDSPKYNEHFKNQLRELLTNYGDIAEVWFDGACGEGPNGKRQVYDWEGYYRLIRELQPNAVIAVMGPDVRWVGTESGYGRETEWSVVPIDAQNLRTMTENTGSTKTFDFFMPPGDLTQPDIGSREKLKGATALVWYPSEVDVSIRPGWFYHASQDSLVKSPEKLVDIYYSSIGRNSLLLLNLPPDRRGLIHENDVQSLREMRAILDATFNSNLALGATVTSTNSRSKNKPKYLLDGNKTTYWAAEENVTSATLEFSLKDEVTFDRAMLQEFIQHGQRVEKFALQWWDGSDWQPCTEGTTIGYKRLFRFPAVTTNKVRLVISEARANPEIAEFGVFKSP